VQEQDRFNDTRARTATEQNKINNTPGEAVIPSVAELKNLNGLNILSSFVNSYS
jgi:hypothetical protein